jgi:hypothetical protein
MPRLGLLAFFLAAGVAGTGGDPGRLAVLGDDGRVTVVAGGKVQTVTPRHAGATLVAWSPQGDRLVVVETVEMGTKRPFRLIVRGLTGKEAGKARQFQPASQELLIWREVLDLSWPRADLITVVGRIDPDTVEMARVDARSGALLSTEPGKGFFWSPDGVHCAVIGWFPHFAPAPDFGDRVEIDGHEIFRGPKGNEIPEPLLWSSDGTQLAFLERHGEGRDLLIVPAATAPGAAPRRLPLAAASTLLAWSDDGRALLLRSGQDDVRFDPATGVSQRVAAADLAAQGFGKFAAAAESAARAAQMGGQASSWWTPHGAAETPKGKTS